jgi:hypothetical protein
MAGGRFCPRIGGVGWEWSDWFSTVAGHRAHGVDYDDDGFVYDLT